jgi:putative oxidoreductase
MSRHFRLRDWSEANQDFWWDALRVFVGIALFLKGVGYLRHLGGLVEQLKAAEFPYASSTVAQYAAVAHVAGGLLLAFGLFTRLAAAIQVPNLLGAIFFVHLKEGLFTSAQTLEFAVLVLVILVLYALGGAGRWSVDWYFSKHKTRGSSEEETDGRDAAALSHPHRPAHRLN